MNQVKKILHQEQGLIWTGVVGVVLGVMGIIFALLYGNEIPPEGKWSKAFTFDLAIGVFALTTAVFVPMVDMKGKQRAWFVYPLIFSFWIAYAIETIQNARGFDPRFTQAGAISDRLIGLGLGLDSILIMACWVYFMVFIFRKRTPPTPLFLSLRYASISIVFAFLSGVWMSILQGRITPDAVDIMVLHFVGFHGYQSIPLIYGLLSRSDPSRTRTFIHVAGIAWIALCLFLILQFGLGYHLLQLSIPILLAGISLGVWIMFTLIGLKTFMNTYERG